LVSIRDSIPFDGNLRLRLAIAQQDAERFKEADKDTKKVEHLSFIFLVIRLYLRRLDHAKTLEEVHVST
jgi:hypothetical protein